MDKYVITGGPGVGKTTLVDLIRETGAPVVPEAATIVIKEQLANENPVLPTTDLVGFQELIVEKQAELERNIPEGYNYCFMDRGLLDNAAYLLNSNEPIPDYLHQKIEETQYAGVFLLDRLPNYENTEVRTETEFEARKIHHKIEETYRKYGYEPINIPVCGSKVERAELVKELAGLDYLAKNYQLG